MDQQIVPEPKKKFDFRNSYGIKLIIVTVLLLLMLIPLVFINNIIDERADAQLNATNDIIHSMGGKPEYKGVVLRIPYYTLESEYITETKETIFSKVKNYAYYTAEQLKLEGFVEVENRTRGIYNAPVLTGDFSIEGMFDLRKLRDELSDYEVEWGNVDFIFLIEPLRTINTIDDVIWNNGSYKFESGEGGRFGLGDFVQAAIPINEGQNDYSFNMNFNLKGGGVISFVSTAGNETIKLESDWSSPSFFGAYLPSSREWSDEGFSAEWINNSLSNNIPRIWYNNELVGFDNQEIYFDLDSYDENDRWGKYESTGQYTNSYGVKFMKAVNSYSQSKRSSKYGFLFLLVPFLTFFLFELLLKVRIHPIQYLLAGAADLIFYLLLVSISEHILFNYAYLISALAIIVVLGTYSLVTVGVKKGWIMSLVLSVSYLFLFITLQQEDYALLYGSIGLLVIISIIMFVTRRIKWYNTSS